MALTLTRTSAEDLARAEDPATTGQTLVELATHRNGHVRAAVAKREDCPLAAGLTLAHDRDKDVIENLLGNAKLPISVLEVLANERRGSVRAAAQKRLAIAQA